MVSDDVKSKMKSFVAKYIRNAEVDDDEDLFATGMVNSLFAMQLVMFVEKEFVIKVENEDLDIDNFRSLNAIINLIERKSAVLQNN